MKRDDHRPAFRGEIDGHYSLARLNSFPIFRGGVSKRRSNGSPSLPVRNNLLVRCGSSYFSSVTPPPPPRHRSPLSTCF